MAAKSCDSFGGGRPIANMASRSLFISVMAQTSTLYQPIGKLGRHKAPKG